MRALILAVALLPVATFAQTPGYDQGGQYEGVFASHRADGDNGSVRVGARLGSTAPATNAPPPSGVLTQPAGSGVQVYHPRSLNDLARDWAKAHPDQLPNRRKSDPQ